MCFLTSIFLLLECVVLCAYWRARADEQVLRGREGREGGWDRVCVRESVSLKVREHILLLECVLSREGEREDKPKSPAVRVAVMRSTLTRICSLTRMCSLMCLLAVMRSTLTRIYFFECVCAYVYMCSLTRMCCLARM